MPGLRTIVPTTFTDGSLPVLQDDPILPTQGALFLTDPTGAKPWASGVPASAPAGAVPNVAWRQAKAMIPAGTETTLGGEIFNLGLDGVLGKVERTPKGGLHAIISVANTTTVNNGFGVILPELAYAFIRANPLHKYYQSLWQRTTRGASLAANDSGIIAGISTASYFLVGMSFDKYIMGSDFTIGSTNDAVGAARLRNGSAVPGAAFGSEDISGILSNGSSPGHKSMFNVGNRLNANNNVNKRGKVGSRIFYRAYLEDLTVSGRTHAQVAALDQALFDAAFAVGGRYYGDTVPTDPATIP